MNKIGKIAFCGLLLLVSTACNKVENALPESNDAVFHIEGAFGNDELFMVAGDDGMYMYIPSSPATINSSSFPKAPSIWNTASFDSGSAFSTLLHAVETRSNNPQNAILPILFINYL